MLNVVTSTCCSRNQSNLFLLLRGDFRVETQDLSASSYKLVFYTAIKMVASLQFSCPSGINARQVKYELRPSKCSFEGIMEKATSVAVAGSKHQT